MAWPAASAVAEDVARRAADPLAFRSVARPLLETHCFECHGPEQQEAGLNFAAFADQASILAARERWRKAREALEAGDMPPPESTHELKAEDRQRLIAWIREHVETVDRSSPIYLDPGPPLVRQMTRLEYNQTVRDLLGFQFDAAEAAGIRGQESEDYANMAGAQVFDELLLEKYFTAADAMLDALFNEPNRQRPRNLLLIARPHEGVSPQEAARTVLEKFVPRAYRRPVPPAVIDKLMALFNGALAGGEEFEPAIRKALKPVLVSPFFLFRLERDDLAAGSQPYPVTDHELAVRLSYFLWSTMPDETLFKLADAGTLHEPAVLEAQVRRMLADPKSVALTDQFFLHWMHINSLRRALPQQNNFPTFTRSLKDAMEGEMRTFFEKMKLEDHSVLDLLDANYTYVNQELARHYGIPGVQGGQMVRVDLAPELHRGGLLGMAGVLTLTSHTDRTKPTARGKWVLETLLGTPPSPPPANVSNFKPQPKDQPAPKTFREKLAQHATQASCAACHRKIDPLGFALENFDAIGTWREQVGGEPVDNIGRLPGGDEFHGVDGLRQVLRARQGLFVRNVIVQLMTYALGRHVEYYDELAVTEIAEGLEREDYKFSALVRGIVTSRPFLYRRNAVATAAVPVGP